mgnify:CR=1 FL=1
MEFKIVFSISSPSKQSEKSLIWFLEQKHSNEVIKIPFHVLTHVCLGTTVWVPDNIRYVKEMGKEIDKINMFFTDMEARKRMRVSLGQIPGILVTSSIPNNLEINAAGADKGSDLLRLAEFLGIGREATMACGDGENDLAMPRAAGLGVALENGGAPVQPAGDLVTVSHNAAGVASARRTLGIE